MPEKKKRSATATWQELMRNDAPLVLPGAYDALSAKLIEQTGFSALVVGGFPLVGSRYGLPDIGLVGLGEMAAGMRDIISATSLPVLVDGDHGYGDVKNVAHTVRTYEQMGAAAILLEDQVMPKRCGHAAGKDVVPMEVMEQKVRAATSARDDENFFLIARTDARAVLGLDEALRRAENYIKAGADGIFVEAPESVEELETIAKAFDVPQMCNILVGGRTPLLSNKELSQMGYKIIVHGTTLIKRVAKTLEGTLKQLLNDNLEFKQEEFATLESFMRIVGVDDWANYEENS